MRIFIFLSTLYICGTAAAAWDCEAISQEIQDVATRCKSRGFVVPKPGHECDKASWSKAQTNIGWAVYSNKGAKATYMNAWRQQAECDVPSEDERSFRSLLVAQAHNQNAQCEIYICRSTYVGLAGYREFIRKHGELPESPLSAAEQAEVDRRRAERDAARKARDEEIEEEYRRTIKEIEREARREERREQERAERRERRRQEREAETAPASSDDEFVPDFIPCFGCSTPSSPGQSNIRIAPSLQR
jgi:hypothetical protein